MHLYLLFLRTDSTEDLDPKLMQVINQNSTFICDKAFFFFSFLGPHSRHVEVPRLGIESELQLLTHTTATAMWDLSHIWDLYHSSQQHPILKPLSKIRDQTCILKDTSKIHFLCATTGALCDEAFFFL